MLENEVYFSKTINSQIILVLEEMVGAMKRFFLYIVSFHPLKYSEAYE